MPLKGDAGFRYNSAESENLLTFPSQFDNAAWTKTRSSITADATTAPDGTTTADKLVEDATASNTHLVLRGDKGADNTEQTVSVYAQAAGRDYLTVILADHDATANGVRGNFNLATGASSSLATGDGSLTSVSISDVGDGWYRCSVTGTPSATGAGGTARVEFRLADSLGNTAYNGDGTSGVYLWGASLTEVTPVEVALEFPLFRPTVGSSKVRFEAWSLSRKNREVVTIGDGVQELRASLRFHDDAYEILRMLEAGVDGRELTYFPSLAAGVGYPCQLVEPSGETLEVLRDSSSLGRIGRVEVPLLLRRTDGGDWSGMF